MTEQGLPKLPCSVPECEREALLQFAFGELRKRRSGGYVPERFWMQTCVTHGRELAPGLVKNLEIQREWQDEEE